MYTGIRGIYLYYVHTGPWQRDGARTYPFRILYTRITRTTHITVYTYTQQGRIGDIFPTRDQSGPQQ